MLQRILILCIAFIVAEDSRGRQDCSAELAEIDRRIESGNYDEQRVKQARMMRDSLVSLCPIMPADAVAGMMDSFEDLLPTKSEEELLAERRARSDQLKAERTRRKAARAEAEEARSAQVSPVVRAAATARSLAATYLERSENMYYTYLWDWHLHNGNLRLLYASSPSLEQFTQPDWTVNLYVAEMTPSGETTHRHIFGEHVSSDPGFSLRREHDELLRLRQDFGDNPPRHSSARPTALERWSITDRRLLASVDLNDLDWEAGGQSWQEPSFLIGTSDGNLLFQATQGGGRSDRQVALAWFKLTADGRLIGSDTYSTVDSAGPWGWFQTGNGGGGLIVNVLPIGGPDIDSTAVLSDDERTLGSMRAHITTEKRALVIDANGKLASEPIVTERTIMPLPDASASAVTDPSQMMAVMQRQQQWQEDLGINHDANRSTRYQNIGLRRVEMMHEIPGGFAILTRVTANTKREPPIHGPWIVEFDRDGNTTRRIHLQQLAEDLDTRFDGFIPAPGGGYYVHAPNSRQIVRIDENGVPVARRVGSRNDVTEASMVADTNGIWLFGHSSQGSAAQRVYLERIEF